MPHHTPLISTIVAALVLAFILGATASRFRISPLVGYLLAGVLIGPFTPGYVADQSIAKDLAEIGVILLMFGVGLHFTLDDLLSVKAIAVPGALVQIASATVLGMGLAWLLGWTVGAGLVFAFESAGLTDPKDFLKNAAKTVQQGLPRDQAVRALTLDAATIAGAGDRLGSLETGKIANLVVTEGDLFDEKMTIKHVFVDGRPVNLDLPPARDNRRGSQ